MIYFVTTVSLCGQLPVSHKEEGFSGEMKIYFDSLLRETEPDRASYFAYTLVDLNKDVWNIRHDWHIKKWKLERGNVEPGVQGKPVALDGTFKWFSKNYSRLIAQEQFRDGRWCGQTIVYDKKERPLITYDYEKRWNGEKWSLYFEKYNKGKIEKSAFQYFDSKKHRWQTICTEGCYVSRDFR